MINWNRLKKFVKVEVDPKCMQTNFGGCGLSSFKDFAPFRIWPNFPLVVKKLNQLESAKKFVQVGVDVKCLYTNFGWRGLSGFRDFAPFLLPSKTAKIPFQTMDYSP